MSFTYSVRVIVVLGMQHAMDVSYCHLWPAPLCNIFPQYLINGMIFLKKS